VVKRTPNSPAHRAACDRVGGSIFAIATDDTKAGPSLARIEIKGINEKIAGLLGVAADQILINDVAIRGGIPWVYGVYRKGPPRP